MKEKAVRLWLIGVLCLAVLAVLFHYKVHFDWDVLRSQLRHVLAVRILLAVALIYLSVCLRAFRWATLLKPRKRVASVDLIGPQFIGFTCVALFGSLGDLVRPYLLARTVELPISSQIATYTIERMFDIAAAALIFSGALLATPMGAQVMHREIFVHVGIASLTATLAILLMAVLLRGFGEGLANWIEARFGHALPRGAAMLSGRVRSFRDGLHTIASFGDLLIITAISLTIWGLVATAYLQVVHAFVQIPQLVNLTFSQTMLLVAASIGGSLIQLPVIGWFTQIAATGATMHAILGVPTEAATACGALLLGVTFIFLIPGGLVFAQATRVSIRKVLRAADAVDLPTGVPLKMERR